MKGDTENDALLQDRFARLRAGDAESAPDFAKMMTRVRREVDARANATALEREPSSHGQPPQRGRGDERATERAVRSSPADLRSTNDRRPLMRWAVPLALAAGIGAIVFLPRLPDRAADREFDRLVSEWSRTSEATRHAPTDGLLDLPGFGLVEDMPAIGSGVGSIRGQS